jgi:hypothetical protein
LEIDINVVSPIFFEEALQAADGEIAGVPTRRFEFRLVSLLVILACMSFFVFVLGS